MKIADNQMADEPLTPEQEKAKETAFALRALTAIKTREQEFETGWWKQAESAEKIYSADNTQKIDDVPYNILYSNTEVLLPSLYSATPKPDVRTRFKMQELKPIPEVCSRFLTVAADPASPGGDSFNTAMTEAVLSALVPGMGFVRVRYIEDRAFPLVYESGHFKMLIWGKASRWAKVPWVAFKHCMNKNAMFKQFNIDEADQENFEPSSEAEDEKEDCTIYEFWDKNSRKVYFLCEEWREKQLSVSDDPLGMENFFPTPGILTMTARSGKMLPIPLYNFYRNQAEELNRVSVRLNKVLAAIRVRGAYNGLLGEDLKKLLAADELENELVAAAEAGLLAQQGGFDKAIWLLPIEQFVKVANELYKAREAIKQVIYELTGISDIIRGSSVASETATAQDLKNKWGTVRLRRMQTLVADYARDLFRMSVDCGSDRIPAEKWKEITQMPQIPTAQEKQMAIMQLQQLQQQAQQPAIPGFELPPPAPPDPKMVEMAKSPSWEEILGKIKNDQSRTFVVNIQTSSTIDLDTAQDKNEVNEFMAAMGQLMPGLQGLAQIGPTGMEAAKALLMAVCQRYKFGIDIADVVAKIEPPPAPQNDPKAEAEMQKAQGEIQKKTEELQMREQTLDDQEKQAAIDKQIADLKAQGEMQRQQFDFLRKQLEFDRKMFEEELLLKDKIRQAETNEKIRAMETDTRMQQERVNQERVNNKAQMGLDKTLAASENKTDSKTEPTEVKEEAQDTKIFTSLMTVLEKLTKVLSAPKSVTDSKGKTYTMKVGE